MISVIISSFNRPEMLLKAIESVKKQSFKDFEIIVVDDHSNIEPIIPDGVRYKRLDNNSGGPARPRNEGIMMAKGEYICFLDEDNTLREDHLEILHQAIQDCDVAYGDRMIYEDGLMKGVGISSDFRPDLLMERNFIDTSDFIIRKDLLLEIGGWDERSTRMLDWNLMARLYKYGCSFKHIPVVITNYNIHGSQLSSKQERLAWNPVDVEIELPFCGHTPKEPRVAIFTLTYDRREYTEVCFDTLYDTAGYAFDHFIVDNGSSDGTPEYLKNLKNPLGEVKLILNPDNKGISIASNQALNLIGTHYDIIVKSDNDAYYKSKGWLAKMVEIWKSNRLLALSCYIEGLRDNPGGAQRIGYGHLRGERVGISKHLGGICHFVDAKAYSEFRWNEDSTLHGIQDLELSRYLITKGYGMGYLENWFCEHKDGTVGQEIKYKEYFERRKKEKVAKYQRSYEEIQENESAFSTDTMWGERVKDSINKYSQHINGKVLDIGCNDGFAMTVMRDLGHEVTGIDISPTKVERAKNKGLNVTQGRAEHLSFKDKEFDTVFCSHTLEHVEDLSKAVSEIKRVSKRVVIIIPLEEDTNNPAHMSPFKSGDELKELFSDWVIDHTEELNRYEREFVLIAHESSI